MINSYLLIQRVNIYWTNFHNGIIEEGQYWEVVEVNGEYRSTFFPNYSTARLHMDKMSSYD